MTLLVDTQSTGYTDENLLRVPHKLIAGLAVGRYMDKFALEAMTGVHLNSRIGTVTRDGLGNRRANTSIDYNNPYHGHI